MGASFIGFTVIVNVCDEFTSPHIFWQLTITSTDPVQFVFMNPEVLVPGPGDEVLSRKGKTLKRDEFEKMRKEFYELRGWDHESGIQKLETLQKLELDDIANDLIQSGKIKSKLERH